MRTSISLAGALLVSLLASPAPAATTYTYDDLGRVSTVTYDNGKQIIYSYDPAGNRTSVVTQTGTNQPPVALPDAVTTNENTAAVIHPLGNDNDPDGDTITVQAVTQPTHGAAAVTNSTTVTYTPAAGYSGADSFGYSISDGQGHVASATITVTVVNQAPTAVADSGTVALGSNAVVSVLANDTDPEGDTLTVTGVTAPSHGTATINSGTTVTYATVGGSTATDHFNYTISDGHGNTATAAVTMTITGSNHPPVAVADQVNIDDTYSGTPVTPQITFDPRVNDSDADGDPLTITAVTQGTHGGVSIVNGGTQVTYIYNSSVNHALETTDSFTYTISDGNGGTATATVNVAISVQSNQ